MNTQNGTARRLVASLPDKEEAWESLRHRSHRIPCPEHQAVCVPRRLGAIERNRVDRRGAHSRRRRDQRPRAGVILITRAHRRVVNELIPSAGDPSVLDRNRRASRHRPKSHEECASTSRGTCTASASGIRATSSSSRRTGRVIYRAGSSTRSKSLLPLVTATGEAEWVALRS